MFLNLLLKYVLLFLSFKIGEMMDLITPNFLLSTDFNRYSYGTEIVNTLLINKKDITAANEITFCLQDMQVLFKKNINYDCFYKSVLQIKNIDICINDSTYVLFTRVGKPTNGMITVELHPFVATYFGRLHSDFTKYHLYSLICLSSPTAKKLYLLLNYYIKTGGSVTSSYGKYRRVKIDEIRNYLALDELYDGFHNFDKFLQKHINEINLITDFNCIFTPEKKAKKFNTYNIFMNQNVLIKEQINQYFNSGADLSTTKNAIVEFKSEFKEKEIKPYIQYFLNQLELQIFREKLTHIPGLKTKMADDIATKVQIKGFSSIKSFERWLLILKDIESGKSKITNSAAYIVKSLYQNNG